MIKICDYDKCTGCFVCMNSCPKDAISVTNDKFGSAIPQIDGKKCIDCGLCEKICPVNSKQELKRAERAFAVWSKSDEDKKSSSGGVAAVMSRYIIENGGVVYGAAVKNSVTKHVRVTSISEAQALRGSKYVQSEIGMIYRQVKNDLENGSDVLFTGTPCQSAGLKAYLKKDYEKLVTVDLICHGTPPHSFLKEHLDSVSGKWDSFTFRGKYDYILTAYDENNIVYQKSRDEDVYFKAFSDGLILRENCYSCPYSRIERVSDITVGDFWGIDRSALKNPYDGRISVVLPNTQKGMNFFEKIKEKFIWEERSVEEAANKEQGNLIHPSIAPPDRNVFLENYSDYGFDKAVMSTSVSDKIRQFKKNKLKMKLKKTLIYRGLRKIKRKLIK